MAGFDVSLAVTLDELCRQIQLADYEHRKISRALVAPKVYEDVRSLKARQHLRRGNPVLLLALDLVADPSLEPGEALIS